MSPVMTVTVVLAILNAAIALAVGTVYLRNHRQLHSPMTLALSLFALFFLFHNAVLVYHLTSMMATFSGQAEVFLLLEGILQTGALGALGYATLR